MATTTWARSKVTVLTAVMMILVSSISPKSSDLAFASSEFPNRLEDLGSLGPSYSITEENLFDQMMKEIDSDKGRKISEKINSGLKESFSNYSKSPGGSPIGRASKNRTFVFDPAITLLQDIRDSEGRLIAKAGTRVNPLEHLRYESKLCFFDGNDFDQIGWMQKNCPNDQSTKLVMVSGNPMEAMKTLKRRVYFDQKSTLVERFGITALPATVENHGTTMLVKELLLN